VSANGKALAGEGKPLAKVVRGALTPGQYFVTWQSTAFAHCQGVGEIASSANSSLVPGSVIAEIQPRPEGMSVAVYVYAAQGQPAALPFWVAVLC
jgi:hypothetical protein